MNIDYDKLEQDYVLLNTHKAALYSELETAKKALESYRRALAQAKKDKVSFAFAYTGFCHRFRVPVTIMAEWIPTMEGYVKVIQAKYDVVKACYKRYEKFFREHPKVDPELCDDYIDDPDVRQHPKLDPELCEDYIDNPDVRQQFGFNRWSEVHEALTGDDDVKGLGALCAMFYEDD